MAAEIALITLEWALSITRVPSLLQCNQWKRIGIGTAGMWPVYSGKVPDSRIMGFLLRDSVILQETIGKVRPLPLSTVTNEKTT